MNQSWENDESGPILAQIWVLKFFMSLTTTRC